jgi:hypothetical protein
LDDEVNGVVGEGLQGPFQQLHLLGGDVLKDRLQLLKAAEANLRRDEGRG